MAGQREPGPALAEVFEVVLWGYDRDQVRDCLLDLEERLTVLYAEQRRAERLDAELAHCRREVADLRARLSGVPVVHQVGTEVAEILQTAEQQALAIRAMAENRLAAADAQAARVVAAAHQEAARARRDCDMVLGEHRHRQQRAADEMLAAARREADRIIAAARSGAASTREPEPGPAWVRSSSAIHDEKPAPARPGPQPEPEPDTAVPPTAPAVRLRPVPVLREGTA